MKIQPIALAIQDAIDRNGRICELRPIVIQGILHGIGARGAHEGDIGHAVRDPLDGRARNAVVDIQPDIGLQESANTAPSAVDHHPETGIIQHGDGQERAPKIGAASQGIGFELGCRIPFGIADWGTVVGQMQRVNDKRAGIATAARMNDLDAENPRIRRNVQPEVMEIQVITLAVHDAVDGGRTIRELRAIVIQWILHSVSPGRTRKRNVGNAIRDALDEILGRGEGDP